MALMSLVIPKHYLSHVKYYMLNIADFQGKKTLMGQYNFKALSQNLFAHVHVPLRMHE